jgi:hypothetical protein
MSTTTELRPGDDGLMLVPDAAELAAREPEAEPDRAFGIGPTRVARRRKRFRLSRRMRLVRTGLSLLIIEVALSSLGVIPGHGWPLSLIGGGGATGTANATTTRRTATHGGRLSDELAAKGFVPPQAWAFARVKGLTIYVPTHQMLGIGYHEASTTDGLSLTPLGTCVANDNPARFRVHRATAGPHYMILISRHRRAGPTTAADVAMPVSATVVAPISGVVVKVSTYHLYKYWLDYRVEISPGGGSRLRVVIIHLRDVVVHRGQHVIAGVTAIARPRLFPFKSDINDYVGAGVPHVHLEVKELGPPRRSA